MQGLDSLIDFSDYIALSIPELRDHHHIGASQKVDVDLRFAVFDVVGQIAGVLPECLRLDDAQFWDAQGWS